MRTLKFRKARFRFFSSTQPALAYDKIPTCSRCLDNALKFPPDLARVFDAAERRRMKNYMNGHRLIHIYLRIFYSICTPYERAVPLLRRCRLIHHSKVLPGPWLFRSSLPPYP
jgi:hypothetical protein